MPNAQRAALQPDCAHAVLLLLGLHIECSTETWQRNANGEELLICVAFKDGYSKGVGATGGPCTFVLLAKASHRHLRYRVCDAGVSVKWQEIIIDVIYRDILILPRMSRASVWALHLLSSALSINYYEIPQYNISLEATTLFLSNYAPLPLHNSERISPAH